MKYSRMQLFLRRRRFIVNSKLQFRLLATSLAYVVFVLVILAVALFVPLAIRMWTAELDSPEAHIDSSLFLFLHSYFWPAALLAMLVVGLHSLLTSHRIAGPLYILQKLFERIQSGTIPRPRAPRESDLIAEEINYVNQTIDLLRGRISNIKLAYDELDRAILDEGSSGSEHDQLQIIKAKGQLLGEALGYLEIEP